MANDVETLLADLGRSWDTTVAHIDLDEVLQGHADGQTVALTPTGSGSDDMSARHWRQRIVACVVLVAAFVAMLTLVNRRDVQTPVVTIVPTTSPNTLAPTTTTAPTTPPPAVQDAGAWWPVGRPAAQCGPCKDSALLPDGRVVIVGGMSDGRSVIQIYDPPTASFDLAGTLPEGVYPDRIVALTDRRLLLTGINGEVAIYDPTDESIEVLRERAVGGGTAAQLADGPVLLFGPTSVQSVDLATGQITSVAGRSSAPRAVAPDVVVPLPDGSVLVADHLAADVYDPASGAFTTFGDGTLGVSRALPLGDGRLLLARSDENQIARSTEIYDPTTETVTPVGTWSPAAVLSDGRVLVLEQQNNPIAVVSAAIHDLATGEVVQIPLPSGRRFNAVPVVLDNDRVLIFGNYPGNATGVFHTDMTTAELFSFGDPGLPAECCPPNPQQIAVSPSQPDDWAPLVDHPLRIRVTVPPGGLAGAVSATWEAMEQHTASLNESSTNGYGTGDLTLPADCERGCQFDLPWSITPATSTTAVYASLIISFDAEPPEAAHAITINIESQP